MSKMRILINTAFLALIIFISYLSRNLTTKIIMYMLFFLFSLLLGLYTFMSLGAGFGQPFPAIFGRGYFLMILVDILVVRQLFIRQSRLNGM
jgi:hypothetical protein